MKSWKIAVIAFAGGVACGLLAFVLLSGDANPAVPVSVVVKQPAEEQALPTAASRELLAQIEAQQLEINRLNQLLRSVEESPPPPTAEEREQARREEFDRRIDSYASRRADTLATSLGLNETQRAQLRDIFKAQYENMRARRNGENVEPYNIDDALASVLTPEQFESYLDSTQKEIYNRAELMATTQMVRLNQLLQLSPEQMDPVYEAINYTAQEMMISRQTGEFFNMQEALDQRLSTILTEEQLKLYKSEKGGERLIPGAGGGPGGGRGGGLFGP